MGVGRVREGDSLQHPPGQKSFQRFGKYRTPPFVRDFFPTEGLGGQAGRKVGKIAYKLTVERGRARMQQARRPEFDLDKDSRSSPGLFVFHVWHGPRS